MFPISNVMKVLFLDSSTELQQKWIEPLRAQGWGAIHARSVEEADRVMLFHGDSLAALVVSEGFISWTEQNVLPFIVLTKTWTQAQILKHQNSSRSAFSYIAFTAAASELVHAVESRHREGHSSTDLKATGTDAVVHHESTLSLENFSEVMSKPEVTRTSLSEVSIKFDAPSILLGGQPAQAETSQTSTTILEPTKIEFDSKTGEISLDDESDPLEELDALSDLSHSVSATAPAVRASDISVTQFAVNPSPLSGASDLETLKSYLGLREQDVAILTGQVRSSQERIQQLEMQLKVERARGGELQHMVKKQEQQIENYDREKQVEFEVLYKQVEDLNVQLKERTDKARSIEARLKMTTDEVDKVKERVRVDIRRIRVREKELESQLEILKKDSSALLMARDEKNY